VSDAGEIPNWEWQITPRYSAAFQFSEGLASVKDLGTDDKGKETYTFIDDTGSVVLQGEGAAHKFSDGLAKCARSENEVGYIDRNGDTVVPFEYFRFSGDFSHGVVNLYVKHEDGFRVGYMKSNGKWLIRPSFYNGSPFSDGFALVHLVKASASIYKWRHETWIDTDGKKITSSVLMGSSFYNGLASATPETLAGWGYVDINGKWSVKPQFSFASDFSHGIALVGVSQNKDEVISDKNKYWLIDATGQKVSNLINLKKHPHGTLQINQESVFVRGESYSRGYRTFEIPSQLFSRQGKLILQDTPEWTMVSVLGSLIWVKTLGEEQPQRYGLIDRNGKFVIPPTFSQIGQPGSNGLISVAVPVWSDEEVWNEDNSEYSPRGWVDVYGYGKPIAGLT